MTTISQKIELFKTKMLEVESANKASVKDIDACRKEVNSQRTKLIAEVNYVADLVLGELSALEKEASETYQTNCQQYQTKVRELTRLHEQTEVAITSTSVGSMLETDWSLSTSLPGYDVEVKTVTQKPPRFVTGNINRDLLKKVFGELHHENQYEKKNISSKHVKQISKFTVTQKSQIYSICPVDQSHAWLSIFKHKGLVLVSKEGVVTDTVVLDLVPLSLAMVGTTDILMTSYPTTTFVYKLSLHNKQVTIYADISPHNARYISINQTGDVYVSTVKWDIVVLNQSSRIVTKVSCTEKGMYIACMSAGIDASTGKEYIASDVSIIDESGTTLQTWSGELDNGQTATDKHLCKMSCDRYDRLFVPDLRNHQD
ncbi:uncharacterized protein [Argopecten irradians]|uniref:uncharacterized protein n=1 Tax=Argopecten irradians TaxID=31199 RepID=UPI0037231854